MASSWGLIFTHCRIINPQFVMFNDFVAEVDSCPARSSQPPGAAGQAVISTTLPHGTLIGTGVAVDRDSSDLGHRAGKCRCALRHSKRQS